MIRHDATLDSLDSEIRAMSPTWFDRARAILEGLPASPGSRDFPGLWSEIKDVYIKLQHSKCAFCEKPLEGRIEQDVEHFRPKVRVEHWTVPPDLVPDCAEAGVSIVQPGDGSPARSEPNAPGLASEKNHG